MKKAFIFFSAFCFAQVNTVIGSDLVYTPINPSFGGHYLNSTHLQSLATTQKQFKENSSAKSQSDSERFISMLQSRLYSSLASQVSEAIFGENAQPNGTIVFDNQQITFVNTGTEINLTVTDFSTGQVTVIAIPTLVTP
ncbi:MAG: curli assembly protein CsgF [Rhodomicrobiaceae bacterium]